MTNNDPSIKSKVKRSRTKTFVQQNFRLCLSSLIDLNYSLKCAFIPRKAKNSFSVSYNNEKQTRIPYYCHEISAKSAMKNYFRR